VNVQDGALVHKAPLRPVGRSGASALVSAEDLMTLRGTCCGTTRAWRNWQTHRTQNATGNTVGVQIPPRAPPP
jgi:hypothetical protein